MVISRTSICTPSGPSKKHTLPPDREMVSSRKLGPAILEVGDDIVHVVGVYCYVLNSVNLLPGLLIYEFGDVHGQAVQVQAQTNAAYLPNYFRAQVLHVEPGGLFRVRGLQMQVIHLESHDLPR